MVVVVPTEATFAGFTFRVNPVMNDRQTFTLIAAAPELLAALETAYMALIGYLPAHRNDVTDAAIGAARAAITKATGEAA